MGPAEIVSELASFHGRGPGTDAERRAARWLARELAGDGRDVSLEPFWCRPSWAIAHLWHIALAVAGSLISLASPLVGVALLAIALASVLADGLLDRSPGRRLSPERASQNVVTRRTSTGADPPRVRLILTAGYDAGRTGTAYREAPRATVARLRRATGPLAPGWLGWLAIAIAWLLVVAILRLADRHSAVLGAVQLPATVALVLAAALLVDIALSDWSPAAGDNASGVAAAIALCRALDAAPPRHVSVDLVLQGAAEGTGIGLRHHLALAARTRELRSSNTIVIGFGPCASGSTRWWGSDGRLIPLRYASDLRRLCAGIADREPHLDARAHRGRGATPAFPARQRRLPAIALGCLDARGLVPGSHLSADMPSNVQPGAVNATVQFGLMLVDAIDASVASPSPASRDEAPQPQHRAVRPG